jgi:hypothetical protein
MSARITRIPNEIRSNIFQETGENSLFSQLWRF